MAACGDDDSSSTKAAPATTAAPAAAATTAAAAATTTTAASARELEELVAAAKKEGSVMLYWNPAEVAVKDVLAKFKEKYGISGNYVRLSNSDLAARFNGESQAGTTAADVIVLSDTRILGDQITKGWVTKLQDAKIPAFPGALPAQYVVADPGTAVVAISPWTIAYNTSKVKGADIPKSFKDLADPKWKGRIGMPPANLSLPYLQFWEFMSRKFGEDYVRAIANQNLKYYDSAVPLSQAIGAGEIDIAFPAASSINAPLKAQGAPLDWVTPDLNTGGETVVGVVTKAPHPSAARLFAHFLLSKEGTDLLAAHEFASPYGANLPKEYERTNIAAGIAYEAKIKEIFRR
jgi:iron(III) transport system substrate-binding protein